MANSPSPVYAAISLKSKNFSASCVNEKGQIILKKHTASSPDIVPAVLAWINEYSSANNSKFIATGVIANGPFSELASKLWLEKDIVPFKLNDFQDEDLESAAAFIRSQFDEHHAYAAKVGESNLVNINPLATLVDYEAITYHKDFQELLRLAEKFKGKSITFISATPQGGGVALMRHALMRLYSLLAVKASWHVLKQDAEIFKITKTKFHNILQNINNSPSQLTTEDKQKFLSWTQENALILDKVFKKSDVTVIDDPQPSGLIPYIKSANPKARIIYRSHIDLQASLATKAGSPQKSVWDFLWQFIKEADMFVTHPVASFIPDNVPKEKIVKMGATTDPLDGLNKDLTDDQKSFYLNFFNNLLDHYGHDKLDLNRPYIIQIARFDPSKGIPDVLESFHLLKSKLKQNKDKINPQLVIAGNASIDDPDGIPVFKQTIRLLKGKYKSIAADTKVLRLPHFDQLLNSLLRESSVVLQLSHREGFEIKITEAKMKSKPVVAYKVGGIPLQIKNQKTGFLVEVGDTKKVADILYRLLTKEALSTKIAKAAKLDVPIQTQVQGSATFWLEQALR